MLSTKDIVVFWRVAGVKWTDPDEDSLRMGAARHASAKLEPFAGGAYVNALSDEGHGACAARTPMQSAQA
jgi:hypothetical protein